MSEPTLNYKLKMNWIEERIRAEYRKHNDIDWAKISATKIESEINNRLKEAVRKLKDNASCLNCGCTMEKCIPKQNDTHICCCPECDHVIRFSDLDEKLGDKLI